jgi:tRNA-dihydrouridine synthase
VDFLVLHPRTVAQKYDGVADHGVTARVVRGTRLPVIANGDIRSAADGGRVLGETGAAGLMLGRGAIADPALFLSLRGVGNCEAGREERRTVVGRYLREMLIRYGQLFCDDTQVLSKVKEIITYLDDPELAKPLKELQRAKTVRAFEAALQGLY